jgi:hypothetical protein
MGGAVLHVVAHELNLGEDQKKKTLFIGTSVYALAADNAVCHGRHFPAIAFLCLPVSLRELENIMFFAKFFYC